VAIAQIERLRKGSIMRMGADSIKQVESISPRAQPGCGIGWRHPRAHHRGLRPESSGKTTLCLHVIANSQRSGGVAAFIDAEHALDIEYAGAWAWTSKPAGEPADTGEQALEIAELLIRSNAVDVW